MTLDRRGITIALLSLAGLAMPDAISATAHASPIAVGGGLEYAHGAGDEITRTGHAFVAGRHRRATLTMAGARYDHNVVGAGSAGIAALGIATGPLSSWQVLAARFVGDGSFRAWRVRTGPQWSTPEGRSLGLFFVHWDDNLGGRASGAAVELGVPVAPRLQARLNGGWAAQAGGAAQGAAGLAWTPLPALELSGDVGLARGAAPGSGFTPTGARRGRLELPVVGDPFADEPPGSPAAGTGTDVTFTLGLRVAVP